jgi:hypothetical protein
MKIPLRFECDFWDLKNKLILMKFKIKIPFFCRKICAQLRARLEHDTMLVKLKRQQEQRPIAGGGGDVLMPIPMAAATASIKNQQKPQQQQGEAEDVAPLASTVEETAAPKLAADPNDPANLLVTRF